MPRHRHPATPRRPRGPLLLALLLLAGCAAPAARPRPATPAAQPAPAAQMARAIEAVLDAPPFHRTHWGVEVAELSSGRVLYQRNAQRHFVPASNLKLVVAATALARLGADFRYRTTLHATGPLQGGVLQGDLVVRGHGDPTLSGRYAATSTAVFQAWADSLRARGVRRIAGGVIADQSAWDSVLVRGDWEAYDQLWWYAAPVAPLGYNDNAIDLQVLPATRAGAPARVTPRTPSGYFRLENRSRTTPAGRAYTLDFARLPGAEGAASPFGILAHGEIPLGAEARTESFAVADPGRWAGTVLREVLERSGIPVGSPVVRVVYDAAASPAARAAVLFEHRSPPLPQIIGPILLTSQNWFAEQLLKTLGREVAGEGSWEAGVRVEREFLVRDVGIDSAAFVLRDGSGLAAGNLVTPHALVQLLRHAHRMPGGDHFRAALPLSGRTGSLARRLEDLPGQVAAKSGYIYHVDSLSGYLAPAGREPLVFSIVANASGVPSARVKQAIDEVVRHLAQQAPRRP